MKINIKISVYNQLIKFKINKMNKMIKMIKMNKMNKLLLIV